MSDEMATLRQEFAAEQARLHEALQRELAEHRDRLDEEKAKEIATLKAAVAMITGGPPAHPPPPPPLPPRDVHLVLQDDLANLPGRRASLPTSITIRGQTTNDRERMKVILAYARLLRKLPGSIMMDPLEDLQEVINRFKGARGESPASQVARSRSGGRKPPRPRVRGSASRSRGRSPRRRSRSPVRRSPPRDNALEERVRQCERRMTEMASDIRELREQLRQHEEKRKWKVVHRSSLQARTAPPIPRTAGAPGETFFMEDELSPEGKMLSLKWRNLSFGE
jgi:hypothetical protein